MNNPFKKIQVAICGGGISGLCLAFLLSRCAHIQVDVFEATGRFREIGAGVMIWSRTWRILELMGLASQFSMVAHAPPDGSTGIGFDFRRSDQPGGGFRFHLCEMPYGCIRFHRAAFLDVLVDNLPEGIAHFNKRLIYYSTSGPLEAAVTTLHFEDGTATTCDVLVGCDGIKSSVRDQMFSKASMDKNMDYSRYKHPVWTGSIAYRGLIAAKDIQNPCHTAIQAPTMYCGKSKHVVAYSISQGEIINVVTFSSQPEKRGTPYEGEWVNECSQQEVMDCYRGWEPEATDLLNLIKHPTRWAIHHLEPLPFYVHDRAILVGDAAHAMAPHQGAGAGQAIEDAFILSQLLIEATPNNLNEALVAYDAIRRPIANAVLRGSYKSGMMYEFDSEFGDNYKELGPSIQKQWDWVERTSPEEDLARALTYYRSSISKE